MRFHALLLLVAAAGCVQPAAPSFDEPTPTPRDPAAPYAGEQARDLKALSPEEVEGYAKGAGLGYAKPAELNSYPGPLHALEMAERLGLSEEQRTALEALRADMLARAVPLGERYLLAEATLERAFRDEQLDEERLREILARSAAIEAELRFVHLQTHLATKALLTPHQVALYDEARGYGKADHSAHGHG